MKKAAPIAIAMLVLVVSALLIVFGPWHPWGVCFDQGDGQVETGKERWADNGEEPFCGLSDADVADRGEFDSDEDYQRALIESAEPQVEVPKEPVDTSGEGQYGYFNSILEITFYFEYGKARAQKVIEDCGGVWVSDTFEWPSSSKRGKATAEVYFPQCDGEDALQAMADELKESDGVDYVSFDTWFASVSFDGASSTKAAVSEDIFGYRNNDVESPLQVWLDLSNFHQAWEKIRCQGEVEVAVLDSGIDLDHPDLVSNIGTTMPYDAFNMTVLQGVWEDACGHGTEVSGIVSAVTDNGIGVAGGSFNAKIIPIRVNSRSTYIEWQAVKRALEYIENLSNKPDVINMSFGGVEASFRGDAGLVEDIKGLISGLRDSCSVVCVAAAGNSSDGSLILPAAWEGVVSVGSVAPDGSVASTSTRNDYVDICANGADVLSTQNPSYSNGELYGVDSGTSFASPQVAAVAALVKAQHPSWDADKVEAKLLGSADSARCFGFIDVDGDGKDDVGRYGHGLLDAAAAVGWRQSPSTYVDPFDEILRKHGL